ncbi:MAG: GIY-YIG nuclease family protein [Sphaerochaeta sp.]|uniref:GIY-YIG nuclease family protein n=1 Tax=Sphaerochaeta sp. TaxID=1972642 RepID=UPI002FC86534
MNKKQLRKQYEDRKPPMGVYLFACNRSGERYIGCSKDLEHTKTTLFFRLSCGALASYPSLQNQYNEFGPSIFIFTILEQLPYSQEMEDYTDDLYVLAKLHREENPGSKEIHV